MYRSEESLLDLPDCYMGDLEDRKVGGEDELICSLGLGLLNGDL